MDFLQNLRMEKERENGEGKTIPVLGQPAMYHLPQNKLFNAKKLHKTTERCCFEKEIKTYLNEKDYFFIQYFTLKLMMKH